MFDEQEQKELLKVMFPDKGEDISYEQWGEFHDVVNFDKLSEEKQTRLFRKYAKRSIYKENPVDFEIVQRLLEKDPTLMIRDIRVEPEDMLPDLFSMWAFRSDVYPKIKKALTEFVQKHAGDVCFRGVVAQSLTEVGTALHLAALDNEEFCEKLQKCCLENVEVVKGQYPYDLVLDTGWIVPTEGATLKYSSNLAKVVVKAADKCPAALATSYVRGGEKKTLLQFVSDEMLREKEAADIPKIKALRDKLPTSKDQKDFDRLISKFEPLADMFVQIEAKHPELLNVRNENAVSLAEELGFTRPTNTRHL